MNQTKIDEIALQCGAWNQVYDQKLLMINDNFNYKKFAELIVRECIDIAQDRAAFDGFPPNDVNHIIDEIKEHFGVEEE